jgi:hypothetical protein
MSQADFWFVRFPDGRILRAANTLILRQELGAGRIPINSTVRRSPEDEWVSIAWTQEFADVVEQRSSLSSTREPETSHRHAGARNSAHLPDHPATVASRLDPTRLHLVGVRGCLEELLAALDSTLVAKKLLAAVVVGPILGGLLAFWQAEWLERDSRWFVTALCFMGVMALIVALLTALLTRLTYVELSRLRPARWSEGLSGIGHLSFRLIVTEVIVGGAVGGLIVLLRWLPFWLSPATEVISGTVLALGMVLEVALWPTIVFLWLAPPILVVEECSIGRGLWLWLDLLRKHLGRVFLYQTMALGLGLLLTASFLVLISPVFLPTFYSPEGMENVVRGTRCLLLGLACAPLLAYWIVANTFIYLNLRYGDNDRR